jgi:hypothetical protein
MQPGSIAASPLAADFERQRHILVEGMIPLAEAQELRAYLENKAAQGHMTTDTFVPRAPCLYGDRRIEELLGRLAPRMEFYTGLQLYPTYSYTRIYKRGDQLKAHRDRGACEISISLNLGQEPDEPWPLFMADRDSRLFSALLRPGDAVIYRGAELLHWRQPYTGESMAQAFLHYVDSNGPNAHRKFDGRAALGLPRIEA